VREISQTSESFFVGGRYIDTSDGRRMVDHAYVQHRTAAGSGPSVPVVMIHGGGQTAMNFETTPDGRPGWSDYFVARGFSVCLLDHPGRGRSAFIAEAYGPPEMPVPARRTEEYFTAPEQFELWPQAHLHTEWPGSGRAGDAIFDQFYASQAPGIGDHELRERLVRDAGAALLDRIGPAVVLTHSMSGPFGWQIADARPDLVRAVVAVEPGGPPFMTARLIGAPGYFEEGSLDLPYGVTRGPITYDPPLAPGADRVERVLAPPPDDPHLVRGYLQPEPARLLANLRAIPVLVVTGEASYHAPYDHCTVAYLRQAGVGVDHLLLAEHGIAGNGHMMMLERNSDDVAALIATWIDDLLA
jgi:pimeloyl-ACP methyl ester carboxylesterase